MVVIGTVMIMIVVVIALVMIMKKTIIRRTLISIISDCKDKNDGLVKRVIKTWKIFISGIQIYYNKTCQKMNKRYLSEVRFLLKHHKISKLGKMLIKTATGLIVIDVVSETYRL